MNYHPVTALHKIGQANMALETPAGALGGCRFCGAPLKHSFADLGLSPLCESFLNESQLHEPEPFYPLHAFVCESCFLVQVEEHVSGEEIFGSDYAYFSSFSDTWLAHASKFANEAIARFGLDGTSQVIELASNDGYLLKNFVDNDIPSLGIEPAGNVAAAAREKGVPTLVKFFGTETAKTLVSAGTQADLLCANNVLAHVPDLNDFVAGMKLVLKPDGVVTIEFPHLMRLIEGNQFDTIYQEHYCYFSLSTLVRIFAHHELKIFDVEELSTHGGSLRIFLAHAGAKGRTVTPEVERILGGEDVAGFGELGTYKAFQSKVEDTRNALLAFLHQAKADGKRVAGYGAPGKGNTLLNYCGVDAGLIEFTVDRNPFKHGKFLPGSHIPVHPVEHIGAEMPDYIIILPWNLKTEIAEQLAYTREWGAKLVVPIPELTIF